MTVNLVFTIEEINYILGALGTRPFGEVQSLIFKIKDDAEKQLAPSVEDAASDTLAE